MTTLDDLKTLYYIKDSFGNYYRLNGDKELVTAREQRRVIKNEIFRVERFQDAVGSNAIAIKTRDALEKIKKKEAGTYRPRFSPDLFTDVHLRPRKLHRCFAEGCRDNEEDNSIDSCDIIDEPEREEYEMAEVRYERIGTVYDECKPDWREFVRQQTEFFRNAEDYISDLRYDLDQVDREIEQALEDMDTDMAECENPIRVIS